MIMGNNSGFEYNGENEQKLDSLLLDQSKQALGNRCVNKESN